MSLPRYALALHTTTPDLGLALDFVEGGMSQEQASLPRSLVLPLGREMATDLHQQLQHFLQPQSWQDLGFLAVAKGPGGFTGTRLGLVTARTIAQQLELPLFALSTLETLALHHARTTGAWAQTIAVSLPAQRGQLFGGIYHCSVKAPPETIAPDQVYDQADWQRYLDTQSPAHILTFTATDPIAHSVSTLLHLAQRYWTLRDSSLSRPHWLQAIPFYGQHPVRLSSAS